MSSFILINAAQQRLQVLPGSVPPAGPGKAATDASAASVPLFEATISTGRAGLGSEEGSGRTPTGRFAIYSLHGENAPAATVFRARIPVGLWPEAARGEDAILARILTLEGLEPHNANTRARYIYIHGTAEVDKLGTPASHGCIRLAPEAMVQLFEQVSLGMLVVINNE